MILDNVIEIESITFSMGSSFSKNEQPIRTVYLDAFLADAYPVTNARYKNFIDNGGYENATYWTVSGWSYVQRKAIRHPLYWLDSNWNGPRQPVNGVSWWEASAFAKFEGKALPTEAQWEYLAGGGISTYPWGEEPPSLSKANYAEGCEPTELHRRSNDVDFFSESRSRCGCWDMAGNVGEWCIDNYLKYYDWDNFKINPVCITTEEDAHVVRGGSGLHDADSLRTAYRDFYSPTLRDNIVGFRCVENHSKQRP